MDTVVNGFIMNRISANTGIRKHGEEAEPALVAEFAQSEHLEVYETIDVETLSKTQGKGVLRAINLIKEKENGILKGCTMADGHPPKYMYDKSQTASPPVSNDSLMLTIMIDTHEKRDVGTADMAGAYLKDPLDDFVVMKVT
jgi:hypothetical protein